MGGKPSTEQTENPRVVVPVPRNRPTKHVSLLVLHNNPQPPEMKNFCRALRACLPPNCMAITSPPRRDQMIDSDNQDNSDFKFSKVPDDGPFPESEKIKIAAWVTKQLQNKGHTVLVCLLTDYDLESLKRGTSCENDKRIIAFSFNNPPVTYPDCICIDVDFETAEPQHIREKMKELANAIKDETLCTP